MSRCSKAFDRYCVWNAYGSWHLEYVLTNAVTNQCFFSVVKQKVNNKTCQSVSFT
jgi:hypothetical protein